MIVAECITGPAMALAPVSSPSRSHYVRYSQISGISYCDFTPARITRRSENPLLQEHSSLDALLYDTVRRGRASSQLQLFLSQAAEGERMLRGKYIEVDFAESYPGCAKSTLEGAEKSQEEAARRTSSSDAYANRTVVSPLFVRSRTERRRTAIRKRSVTKSELFSSLSTESGFSSSISEEYGPSEASMDVEPGVVTYHEQLGGATFGCSSDQRRLEPAAAGAGRRARGLIKPVPFQLLSLESEDTSQKDAPGSPSPPPQSPPDEGTRHETTRLRPGPSWSDEEEDADLLADRDDCNGSDSDEPSPVRDSAEVASRRNQHQALSRQSAQHVAGASHGPPPPKPLPPPKTRSQNDIEVEPAPKDSQSQLKDTTTKKTSTSSPNLSSCSSSSSPRQRSVSFMDSSAGTELGRFPADYLGCRPMDSYIGYADSLAKGLIGAKPVEVMVYVTSEKVRLAPPKNASLLFKSFAVKDLLSVQRCSKNSRIVCVAVWKSRRVAPQCHALRCPSALVSSALYDSILDQTQSVDEIASGEKILTPRSRALSVISSASSSSSSGGPSPDDAPLPPPSPSSPSFGDPPQSPSEFLHKVPAVHVGCAKAGRHDTVGDVIHRVLLNSRPTSAREVSVWLSLAQLRLVDMSDEREVIYEGHETSRIRAIGVHLEDKRFIGYIIKEEGKPLVGHVLRCNSAALMVSLVSFLRQACQIMFSQQGGSLYNELSTDESDIESSTECQAPGNGLLKKLRCITSNHKPLVQTVSTPSFVSHTPSPPLTPTTITSTPSPVTHSQPTHPPPVSPLDYPEEKYAKFSVTYVGSAVAKLPFSADSLIDSLTVFREGGVASGRAAVVKNMIQMHVSSAGINLIDKKHRLFVNRNYPRKQLVGYCRHTEDERVFAFASQRPGYPDEMKCHVFRQVQESTDHILQAIRHWLELAPTTAT